MGGSIRVDPGALLSGGSALVGDGSKVDSVRGELAGVAGSAGALGDPTAVGAFADLCGAWLEALRVLSVEVGSLGTKAESAGSAYARVDGSAMRGKR